jgi:hypothetical protein
MDPEEFEAVVSKASNCLADSLEAQGKLEESKKFRR